MPAWIGQALLPVRFTLPLHFSPASWIGGGKVVQETTTLESFLVHSKSHFFEDFCTKWMNLGECWLHFLPDWVWFPFVTRWFNLSVSIWPLLELAECSRFEWDFGELFSVLLFSALFLISRYNALFWLARLFSMLLSIISRLFMIELIDATTNSSSHAPIWLIPPCHIIF